MEFNLAQVHEAIVRRSPTGAHRVPDRRLTWREVAERTYRLANVLASEGLGARVDGRTDSPATSRTKTTSPSTPSTATSTSKAWPARSRPGWGRNVNYRYVAEELQYLLDNSKSRVIVYHSQFAPTLDPCCLISSTRRCSCRCVTSRATTCSPGAHVVRGRVGERVCGHARVRRRMVAGRPLHPVHGRHDRHAEGRVVAAARHLHVGHGRVAPRTATSRSSRSSRQPGRGVRVMPAAPFMHGAGHWIAFLALNGGNTVVIQGEVRTARSQGRAVGRRAGEGDVPPDRRRLVRVSDPGRDGQGTHDLSTLFIVLSGGAAAELGAEGALL